MHGIVRLALAASLLTAGTRAADAPLTVVVAENFYGDIARQIGGDRVAVVQHQQRLLDLARQADVPVVGITETQPANVSFQDWTLGELDALEKALGRLNS
jgi:hypothetical protein